MGLAIIFVYAFFKFGWSYRLYNYVAIMVGATPPAKDKDTPEAKAHAERVGRLCEVAGRHFNRGQRAFFFALGYLGWFISPWLLMVTSVAVAVVLWRRQFALGFPAARCLTNESAQEQQAPSRDDQRHSKGGSCHRRGGLAARAARREPLPPRPLRQWHRAWLRACPRSCRATSHTPCPSGHA